MLTEIDHMSNMRRVLANLREGPDGRTRDAKNLRQTGISLRLDLGPNPDYRDIAKLARTSPEAATRWLKAACGPRSSRPCRSLSEARSVG